MRHWLVLPQGLLKYTVSLRSAWDGVYTECMHGLLVKAGGGGGGGGGSALVHFPSAIYTYFKQSEPAI